MRRCLRDPTYSRFDTIPECDTHTHTDRHTDTRRRQIPRLAQPRAVKTNASLETWWRMREMVTFDEKRAITPKWQKIEVQYLLKSNRKSYVLYRMLCFRRTWVTLTPQTTPNFAFFVAFHIFVVSKHRDFIFGVQVDGSQSQPTDNKPPLKGAWLRHMTRFIFSVPHPYLRNG